MLYFKISIGIFFLITIWIYDSWTISDKTFPFDDFVSKVKILTNAQSYYGTGEIEGLNICELGIRRGIIMAAIIKKLWGIEVDEFTQLDGQPCRQIIRGEKRISEFYVITQEIREEQVSAYILTHILHLKNSVTLFLGTKTNNYKYRYDFQLNSLDQFNLVTYNYSTYLEQKKVLKSQLNYTYLEALRIPESYKLALLMKTMKVTADENQKERKGFDICASDISQKVICTAINIFLFGESFNQNDEACISTPDSNVPYFNCKMSNDGETLRMIKGSSKNTIDLRRLTKSYNFQFYLNYIISVGMFLHEKSMKNFYVQKRLSSVTNRNTYASIVKKNLDHP